MSCRNELWLSCGQHKSKSQLLCVLIPFPHSVSKEHPLVFNANFFSVPLPQLVDHNALDWRLPLSHVSHVFLCIQCDDVVLIMTWMCLPAPAQDTVSLSPPVCVKSCQADHCPFSSPDYSLISLVDWFGLSPLLDSKPVEASLQEAGVISLAACKFN